MKKNKLFALGCAGIMALGLLAGCGGNGNGGGTTGEKTTITINGSTSVEKLAISPERPIRGAGWHRHL